MQTKNKHIAIVGAGLVGSLLSIYLVKRGYKVTVFEKRANMREHILDGGRSINLALSNRGIRALQHIGLAEPTKKVAIPMHGRMMHNIKGELTFQSYGKNGQFINSVSRSGLNMMLMDEAEKQGVHFFYEYRCEDVDFDKTEIKFQTYGSHMTRKFDMIIGADGAFSAVREAMEKKGLTKGTLDVLEHGYKELRIPSSDSGTFQLQKNALHIWPRESFMLIALPNPNASFTCTLFLPFEGEQSFNNLKRPESITNFFQSYFPDTVPMMDTLLEDFKSNPTCSLVTVRCYPWVRNNVLLFGDAAHGIVPFYGQGMNAGFEDCFEFNELLDKHQDNWMAAVSEFQNVRKPDNDAIAQLALDNFVEMRDLVADEDFLLRKKIEAKLHEHFPDQWIPLYAMVTFEENMRYSEAQATGILQHQIMTEVMKDPNIKANWEQLDFKSIVDRLSALRAN